MAFTAADVKKLREMTSVGMMDCKKALTETDPDARWFATVEEALPCIRQRFTPGTAVLTVTGTV